MILALEQLMEVAASRYSIFRIFRIDARIIRAYMGVVPKASAMMQLVNPGPRMAATAMDSTRPGMELIISRIRMITSSTTPPKYPAREPIMAPAVAAMATE